MAAGNATIGSLKVDLGLNSAEFEAGLKKTQASLSTFATKAAAAGAAVGAAMAAAGIALGVALKGAIDRADEMDELAQKVGLSVESLTRLKYAAEISGVQLDTLSTGIKKLSQGMVDAAKGGTGSAADALKALGISATDATGQLKGSDVVLTEIAAKFAAMENGAQKTALAMALFGKSGAELLPFLNEGADGIAKLAAEADRLGVTLDSGTAAAAGKFNESLDRLKAVGDGVTNQLASAMLPALDRIAAAMLAAGNNAQFLSAVGASLGGVFKVLATAAIVAGAAIAEVAYTLAAPLNAALKALAGDFAGAQRELQWGGKGMVDTFRGSAAAIKALWSDAGASVRSTSLGMANDFSVPFGDGGGKGANAARATADSADRAAEATARYIAQLEDEVAKVGLTADAVKRLTAARQIDAALKRGDVASAERIKALVLEREALQDLSEGLGEAVASQKLLSQAQVEFVNTPAKLAEAIGRATTKINRDLSTVLDKFFEIRTDWDNVFRSFRNRDWASAFTGLVTAMDKVKTAFEEAKTAADKVSAVAGVADALGNAIGGKGGKALSSAANAGATAFQATGNPYVAAAAAVVAGLSKILGPKPTNAGAGFDLRTGQVTGDKRTSETEGAAVSAGKGVQDAVALLKAVGVQFTDSLSALVLGTRDQSYLYFESGKVLRSAVGDSAAAVNASLRALLETANFSTDMQRKVAQAALAAGKTFDQVIQELANLDAVQGIGKDIADQILAITDPKAFDLAGVKANIAEQRKNAQAAADAGYLTAEALAAINGQLSTLEGLKLNEVLAKYGDGVGEALAAASDAVATAQEDLAAIYEGQIGDLETVRDRLADVAEGLADFGRELRTTDLGGLDPRRQLAAAQAAFDGVKGKTDAESLSRIPELGRALIEAQKAAAPNARALAATQAEVRRAAEAGAVIALQQVSAADAQIAALRAQIDALGVNTAAVLTEAVARDNLAAALDRQSAAVNAAAAAMTAAGASVAASMSAAANLARPATNAPIVVPSFDAAALAASLAPAVVSLNGAALVPASAAMVAALDSALSPILVSIAKSTSATADLAQLARDEADAA